MTGHSSRGMSGQSRIIACPRSPEMQVGLPNDSNPASELGTAVHELSEFCLHLGVNPSECKGMVFNKHKVNDKMIESATFYVNYVAKIMTMRPNAKKYIEMKVKISSIDDELLWGTSDLVVVDDENKTLIIGDYKNGFGVVETYDEQYVAATNNYIKGNAQLMGYTLGVLDTLSLWDKVTKVITLVVQPNVEHVDGYARYHEYTMDEVRQWWSVYRDSHLLSLNPDAPAVAGKWCRYCKARGFCATRTRKTMEMLQLDQSIMTLDADQIVMMLEETTVIKAAMDAVYDRAVQLARQGVKVKGHKLVKAIVRSKCTDPDELLETLVKSGHKIEDVATIKPMGKTALSKIADKGVINSYFKTPEAGLTLVPMYDKRTAIMADNKPDAASRFNKA